MPRAACQDRWSLTADAPWRPHNGSGPSRPGQDMTDQIAVENNQFIDYTYKCNILYTVYVILYIYIYYIYSIYYIYIYYIIHTRIQYTHS